VTTILRELQRLREQIIEKDELLKEAAERLEVAWARIEHLESTLEEYRG
jgi:hypothetical protein